MTDINEHTARVCACAAAADADAAGACIGCGSLMLSHGEFCAVCRTALAAYAAMKCR